MNLPLTPVRFKRHAAQLFGRKIGVVCGDDRFTYEEFNERIDRLSAALLSLGIQKGDRVAFLSFNCHRLLEAYFGVPQIGAILLAMNIRLSPEELTHILNDASPRVLCFDPEFIPLVEAMRPNVTSVEHYISLRDIKPPWAHAQTYDECLAAVEPATIDYREIDENSVAELFYTSGTTAYPKGVMLTHRNLYLHALYTTMAFQDSDRDVHLYAVPLFHVNSWGAPHTVTLRGGRHVMLRKFDPATVLALVERERVTRLHMVPTMIIALLNHPNFSQHDLGSVREVMTGGAPGSTVLIREVEEKIPSCFAMGGYGLTETSPVVSIAHLKAHLHDAPPATNLWRKASAGIALAGTEIRIVDLEGRDVARDAQQVGEVIVQGDVVMEGYWRQPEATAAILREGWLHTGDLAVMDDEGYVLIVDRAKDMILTGGENVASAEIERVIYLHPAVLECAVIAVPDQKWGEVANALITLKPGRAATVTEIMDHCRKHLAAFKVPKAVEFRENLPKGGTGKILKKVLRERYWGSHERRVH
jgi:fatty-acyl-CoA synthase